MKTKIEDNPPRLKENTTLYTSVHAVVYEDNLVEFIPYNKRVGDTGYFCMPLEDAKKFLVKLSEVLEGK